MALIRQLILFSNQYGLVIVPHLYTFILQAIRHEAYTHMEAEKEFIQIDPNELYPYLLVNVGSGVSIIKVFVYFLTSSTNCRRSLNSSVGGSEHCIEQIDSHTRLFKV